MKIPTKREARAELARRHFSDFVAAVQPSASREGFHKNYHEILELFARGKIRKLIVTIPPQHGKSFASSVMLPAYLLGLDPELKIAIASYNLNLSSKFNRRIQQCMDSATYRTIFPGTRLKQSSARDKNYIRTSEEFDVVGRRGGVLSVGREGALTGNRVDVMIIDDLYKDALEANSPVTRANAWEWYMSVVKTRLHNDSREVIVMTRWHEEDIVGCIGRRENIIDITECTPAFFADTKGWYRLNFEAVKEGAPTPVDDRRNGEALWEERHGLELLREKRRLDPVMFGCMYQGVPSSAEGLLYGDNFRTYTALPDTIIKKGNYTDTADTGEDYLCSICYEVSREGDIYVTDIVYTQQGMEFTEQAVAAMLDRNATRTARIESNNGGRGFARNVRKSVGITRIEWFHQSANKESRILTNHTTVTKSILMPADWRVRWSDFYSHVTGYRREFRSNRYHDAADVLTGIVESEITDKADRSIKYIGFSGQ